MEFFKKNWFYVLLVIVVAGVFYRIETLPSGIISTGPALPKGATHFSSTDNIPVEAKAPEEPLNKQTVHADGHIKEVVIQSAAGQPPVQITVKSSPGGGHGDENTLVDNDPWHKLANGVMGFLNFLMVMLIIGLLMTLFMRWVLGRGMSRGMPMPMPMPGAMGGGGMSPSGSGDTFAGAPPGADLSFLTVTMPADNHARLDASVILDAGLKRQLLKVVSSIKKQRDAWQAAQNEEIAKEEAKRKEESKGWLAGAPSKVPPVIDMTKIKVRKPKTGRFGHKVPQGHIFTGGPGVGKTLAAAAMAGSAGVPLISVAGTLENTLLGGGAQRVDIVMAVARNLGPCIIFLDEAEQSAGQRGDGSQKRIGASADGTTAKWLAAIDGVQNKTNVGDEFMTPADMIHFVFATNYLEAVDEAARRSGRLLAVAFPKPTLPLLQRLLKHYVGKAKVPLAPDLDQDFLAAATMLGGKTGADIADIANCFAAIAEDEVLELEKHLTQEGLPEAKIEDKVAELRFGQRHFLKGVLQHLMGDPIEEAAEDFQSSFGPTHHEAFHALAGAVAEVLGASNDRMRLLCVQRRQKSLGFCYRSPRQGEQSNLSNLQVFGQLLVAYGGSAAQLVIADDTERFGAELDFYRDSGNHSDLAMAAGMIKDSIAQHYGSLTVGPVSKGEGNRTWVTEMGDAMVNEVDAEIRKMQRLGYAVSWKIVSMLITSPLVWEMMDEILNSRERLLVEDRFYWYVDRLFGDPDVKAAIESIPAFYKELLEKDAGSSWKPERQPAVVRAFIKAETDKLEAKYNDFQAKLAAEALAQAKADAEVSTPAETAKVA